MEQPTPQPGHEPAVRPRRLAVRLATLMTGWCGVAQLDRVAEAPGAPGCSRRQCSVKTVLACPGLHAMVRWQIWQRITGTRVTVTGRAGTGAGHRCRSGQTRQRPTRIRVAAHAMRAFSYLAIVGRKLRDYCAVVELARCCCSRSIPPSSPPVSPAPQALLDEPFQDEPLTSRHYAGDLRSPSRFGPIMPGSVRVPRPTADRDWRA